MCYVPSIAVFCSESIECFPGTASKYFLIIILLIFLLIIIYVTPVIVHFIILTGPKQMFSSLWFLFPESNNFSLYTLWYFCFHLLTNIINT